MSIEKYIDLHFNEMIENIQKIIRIKTVKETAVKNAPYGEGIQKGLNAALLLAETLGFKTVNLDNYIGYAEYGEGDEYIGILGHLDVVPEGLGWTFPPYGGDIHDGNLISRGALDNKAPIISCLYSLKALIDSYPDINKRVRVIFGCNEESGTDDIEYYLSKEKPPKYAFTPDGRFPVIHAEKGMITFSVDKKWDNHDSYIVSINGGGKSNVVPQECTALLREIEISPEQIERFQTDTGYHIELEKLESNMIKIVCLGKPAHAASPHKGKNAVSGMMLFLNLILDQDSFKDVLNFFFQDIGADYYGQGLGISREDGVSGKLTANLGVIRVEEDNFYLKFNIRYPVTCLEEDIVNQLEKHFQGIADFRVLTHNKPLYFDKEHPLVQILHNVYVRITGRQEEPVAIGGGTYAKLLPNTVAFGPNFPELNSLAHQADEYIPLDTIKIGAVIYAYALHDMLELL